MHSTYKHLHINLPKGLRRFGRSNNSQLPIHKLNKKAQIFIISLRTGKFTTFHNKQKKKQRTHEIKVLVFSALLKI